MEKEIWKDVIGYEGLYQVSNLGRVKSLRKNLIMKLCSANHGYLNVGLNKNLKKSFYIHRLVAQAFIPNPENKPQVNHKDGNRLNNKVENLEWNTNYENMRHGYDTGLIDNKKENNGRSKLKEKDVIFIRKSKLSQKELSEKFKISKCQINKIINNLFWK
jgi:predicted XRE-type DNA-binding protein